MPGSLQPAGSPPSRAGNARVGRVAAKAALSPLGVALGALGAGVGILDKSAVVAVVTGAIAWAAGVAATVFRARRRSRRPARPSEIDPWSVSEPWRSILAQVLGARERFDATLSRWPEGPTHERLADIQPRLWARVDSIVLAVRQAASLGGAGNAWPRSTGPLAAELADSLRKVQAERNSVPADSAARRADLERAEEVLASQLRACRERDAIAQRLIERIRAAVVLLDQAITELIAMAVSSALGSDLPAGLDDNLDEVADEIRLLADALDRSGIPEGPQTP